jgi:hypothetical protein
MTKRHNIPYDQYIEKCLRRVVHNALKDVEEHGVIGDHHFYITFQTNHPGVVIPAHLLKEYPEDMVVVLQHQFSNLDVQDTYFEVDLVFSSYPETIRVDFDSIMEFSDPSVQFQLQFYGDQADEPSVLSPNGPAYKKSGEPSRNESSAKVISLDQFRSRKNDE